MNDLFQLNLNNPKKNGGGGGGYPKPPLLYISDIGVTCTCKPAVTTYCHYIELRKRLQLMDTT